MFKRSQQLKFQTLPKNQFSFGGSLLKRSNAKTRRPISYKNPMHLVLRSSKAKGIYSFLSKMNQKKISRIVQRQARLSRIQLLEVSNVGNHLHLLVKIKAGNLVQARFQLAQFLRAISGLIARHILGVERGHSKKQNDFWDQRPFSRIVMSYAGIKIARDYVLQNTLKALGIIPHQPRRLRFTSA